MKQLKVIGNYINNVFGIQIIDITTPQIRYLFNDITTYYMRD